MINQKRFKKNQKNENKQTKEMNKDKSLAHSAEERKS